MCISAGGIARKALKQMDKNKIYGLKLNLISQDIKLAFISFSLRFKRALKPQAMEDAVPWNYWKSNHKQ